MERTNSSPVILLDQFIAQVGAALQGGGYQVDPRPQIPGVQALLYAASPQRFRSGFAKIEDHLLFVDWDNVAFGRLDELKEIYKRFSVYANRGFKTPHALRMQLPNLAVVAVSPAGFTQEALAFARYTSLNPWYGGEIGQIILVDLGQEEVTSLVSMSGGRYPRPGAFGLSHAAGVVRKACERAFFQA